MGHMAKNRYVLKFESGVDPFLDAAAEHERDIGFFHFLSMSPTDTDVS